jgi:hypothetical protein
MSSFIFEANIANYEKLIATETDAKKIAMVQKLMAEEEIKFSKWLAENQKRKAVE